jgi:hypothetical protein
MRLFHRHRSESLQAHLVFEYGLVDEKDLEAIIGRIYLTTDMPETASEVIFWQSFIKDLNL